jgi:hypothetical protein
MGFWREFFRNISQQSMGSVSTNQFGQRELRTTENLYLGHYDPTQGVTRDRNNLIVGYGDQLPGLLDEDPF